VVSGATDVPVSDSLILRLLLAFVCVTCISSTAGAVDEKPLHYSADRQVWNRRENKIELFSNARIKQPGEILTADYMILDLASRTIDARGNCVYIAADTVIRGEEMQFNLDSRTGTIIKGRVSNERFSLAGERINKLGAQRFQTHWGEYSTCRDCPQSWTLTAEDVDMQIDGYAFMSNVTAKIKDAPFAWVPYLVVPMKTRRQTGFLFPNIGSADGLGVKFVLPFFWAINRSADMTFGLGDYSQRGRRLEWESRYALSDRSFGRSNFYYLRDHTIRPGETTEILPHRWALDIAQTQELPFGIEQKLRIIEVSDNQYPIFIGDVPGRGEATISSDLIFSYGSSEISGYVAGKRYRNLLNTNVDPDPDKRLTEFDPKTVQPLPSAVVTTNDQFLFGTPIAAGITLGVTNFTRTSGAFDYDDSHVPFGTNPFATGDAGPGIVPGVDPVRKATRASVTPSLYTTLRPLDSVSVIPSLRYYSYFYSFHNTIDNLYRGYLLFQTDLSMQFERIFEMSDPEIPRVKHLIRPTLTYSYIPYTREDPNHPFLRQINYRPAYRFDNYDIVPITRTKDNVNYFVPLGNSLAYGFTSQLVRRRGKQGVDPSYQRSIELSANHSINFLEKQEPLSRFNSNLAFNFDHISSVTEYTYTPYTSFPQTFNTSATYVIERGMREKILSFDRSFSVAYGYNPQVNTSNATGSLSYSLSDYILPSLSLSYDFRNHQFQNKSLNISFQSPSHCWRFSFGITEYLSTGFARATDFSLNLTGTGFGGFTDYATQAGVYKEGG